MKKGVRDNTNFFNMTRKERGVREALSRARKVCLLIIILKQNDLGIAVVIYTLLIWHLNLNAEKERKRERGRSSCMLILTSTYGARSLSTSGARN